MTTNRCNHDLADVEILAITPATPGWGFAELDRHEHSAELGVFTVAAWALVRRNDPTPCDCPKRLVVPMIARHSVIGPELPYESDDFQARIVEPGVRAVIQRDSRSGNYSIAFVPGSWTPGEQREEQEVGK